MTDTLAAPPVSRPATAPAMFMKPRPASPALSTAPKITKIATTPTLTPVSEPHSPPSAMVRVPTKLCMGIPGWPNWPGMCMPNTPYSRAHSATVGSGQPIARRAVSSARPIKKTPTAI